MERITFKEKIGYSLGDVAANLVFQVMMVYQLKFYTDIFGLEGAVAGAVLLFAPLAGALIDPLVGIITDRTNTRWGKYRPWLLWTAVPFAVFYVLAFWNPGIENKTLVAVYATISYILLLSVYSFNNTPLASLGGVITSDIKERTSITKVRFVCTSIAQFFIQGFTLPLVDHFSTGKTGAHGWLVTISIFAVLACILSVVAFLSTRERIAPPKAQKMSIKADIKETFTNTSWRSLFILTLVLFTMLSMWNSSMNYYFHTYIDRQALYEFLSSWGLHLSPQSAYTTGFSVFNMANAVVQFFGVMFLSGFLANRFGKKTTTVVCMTLVVILTALFYVPSPKDIGTIYLLCIVKSLVYSPTIPLLWAMVADAADYSEYTHNRRATGFCFSGIIFALKAGLGVGAAMAGILLSGFGYVSGNGAVQNETAVRGIRLVSSIIPALLLAIGVIAMFFYPITKRFNEKMQKELSLRRKGTGELTS